MRTTLPVVTGAYFRPDRAGGTHRPQLRLGIEDFSWVTKKLLGMALRPCRERIVSVLESGYGLPALADSAVAPVAALQAA